MFLAHLFRQIFFPQNSINTTVRRGPGLPAYAALLALASGQPAPFAVQGLEAGADTEIPGGARFRPASAEDYFAELPRRGIALESLGELQERLRREPS